MFLFFYVHVLYRGYRLCRVIHAAWPSPAALVEAYRSCEGGKQACVAMVEELKTIAPKSGAKRKLGKQPAENLHSVFMMERS